MTPLEYFPFAASGNIFETYSGKVRSWYIIAGGFLTYLLLSENSYLYYE